MFPVLVVDVLPNEPVNEYSLQMIEACTRALPSGECALSSATPESERPESVAIVFWQGSERREVTVRVRHRERPWVTRHLTFSADDPTGDRWTAVGLTLATLVDELNPGARSRLEPVSPPAVAPPPPTDHGAAATTPKRETTNARAQESKETVFGVAIGGVTGPGWIGGDFQRGAVAVLRFSRSDLPVVAVASLSYAWSDGPEIFDAQPLSTRWYTASLGVGVHTAVEAVSTLFLAALELSGRSAAAEALGRSGSDQELRGRLRLQLGWPMRGRFGAVLGGTLGVAPLGSDDGGAAEALRAPSVTTELLAAVEVRL